MGENSRNVDLITDALAGDEVTAATTPEELNPVLSGSLPAGAVVVDTETVTEDVTALVESVLDRDLPVVLLSQDPQRPSARTPLRPRASSSKRSRSGARTSDRPFATPSTDELQQFVLLRVAEPLAQRLQ